MINKELKEIPIQEIDFQDKTFCLNFSVSSYPLGLFIKETKFLSPLILRKKRGKRRYQIVSGFKRVEALKTQKQRKLPAFIFRERELPERKALLLNFYENLSQRPFNEIEKSLVIKKLQSLSKISEEKLIKFFLPLLGLPPSKKYLENYLSLDKLEDRIKKALAQGELSLEVGMILTRLNPAERKLFLKLIQRIGLNQNKAKIIFNLVEEISHRENKSIRALLQEKEVKEARDFSHLRDYLWKKRYPELSAYGKIFFDLTKGLKLSPGIKITPPPFFEDNKLKIHLEIKEEKELKELLSTLKRVFQDRQFGKLLSLL